MNNLFIKLNNLFNTTFKLTFNIYINQHKKKDTKMNIMFSIRDDCAQAFINPFFYPTVQMAERAFQDTVNDPKTSIHAHPEHYTLYQVGTFLPETGEVVGESSPICIGKAIEYVIALPSSPQAMIDQHFTRIQAEEATQESGGAVAPESGDKK